MFDDLPADLERNIVIEASNYPPSRDTLTLTAARQITRLFTGRFLDDAPFVLDDTTGAAPEWYRQLRLVHIGQSIFYLRKEPGFAEICRRLQRADLRAAHFETFAATLMQTYGFSIHATEETRKLGSDYDFYGISDSARLNTEVTSFTTEVFREKSVTRALRRKRTQVPLGTPAAIVCFVPNNWNLYSEQGEVRFARFALSWLRRNQNINYLVLANDVIRPDTGHSFCAYKFYRNPAPQCASPTLDSKIAETNVMSAEEMVAVNAHLRSSGVGEFYEWIDHLETLCRANRIAQLKRRLRLGLPINRSYFPR